LSSQDIVIEFGILNTGIVNQVVLSMYHLAYVLVNTTKLIIYTQSFFYLVSQAIFYVPVMFMS